MAEKIFEVEIRTHVYVIADDGEDAERVVEKELADILAQETFAIQTQGESTNPTHVDDDWLDSLPYLDPDRNPFVEMTVRQILEQ